MKILKNKNIKLIFTAGVLFCGLAFFVSSASAATWQINEFDADILIMEDSRIFVTERISVEFFVNKHGIYRDIPIKYKDNFGNNVSIDLEVREVMDGDGNSYIYETSRRGSDIRIKIGNPEKFVSGEQTYVIKYIVDGAINYFPDHDEFYWNVTGTEWEVPIKKSSAVVMLPGENLPEADTKCYTGPLGSTAEDCLIGETDTEIYFIANNFLTIVVGWPKGITYEPPWYLKMLRFFKDNFGYILPLPILLFMFYLWRKKGKDPEGRSSIMVQYDPPSDLIPSEMGALVNEKWSNKYIAADLVSLANKGFIKIREVKKDNLLKDKFDYEIIKRKEWVLDKKLTEYEKNLLSDIFAGKEKVSLSDLKNKFYKNLSSLKKLVWKRLISKKYFLENPETVKIKYLIAGILVVAISPFGGAIFGMHALWGLVFSGFIIIIFSFFMPKKTKEGVLAYQYAEGFRRYIDVAEKHRIKWEEKENLFFEFMPYAMVFGLADKWAKVFEGIYKEPPEWYEGSYPHGTFSTIAFTNSLNSFSHSTHTNFVSSPQAASGGSGFSGGSSGGGFGGGGGGSW